MERNTKRLTVRRLQASDWRSMKAIWEDLASTEFAQYDTPHPTQAAAVQAMLQRWEDHNHGTAHFFLAVCLQGTVIGYIALHQRESGYEIGYGFHSAYHGKGYAKESLTAVLAYLKTLGITKFFAGTALNNTPSVALLKSLGFVQTGTEQVSFYKDAAGNDILFDGGLFTLTISE